MNSPEYFFESQESTEATLHRCSYKKVLWKYVPNLQKNTHAELWFQVTAAYYQNIFSLESYFFQF